MRGCLRHSELELRGPTNGLDIDPRSPPGLYSAPLSARTPNPPTKQASGRGGGASRVGPRGGAPDGKIRPGAPLQAA
eukprot:6769865-Alexandrium_andersonii.AAC.1